MEVYSKILTILESRFPGSAFKTSTKYRTMHSRIYVIDVVDKTGSRSTKKIIVKYCRSSSPDEIDHEFESLLAFRDGCNDSRIRVPNPILVDSANKIIVMDHVGGSNLKELMLKLKLPDGSQINQIIDLAAIALSKFHELFVRENGTHSLASPFLEREASLDWYAKHLPECGLRSLSKSFLDFAVWNILVSNSSGIGITLIDFPARDCISTPHLDLARFKFSLEILREHPQFRFLGIEPWILQELYGRFLGTYLTVTDQRMNDVDYSLISHLEREYARKLKTIYENEESPIRLKLEGIYMKRFLSRLLNDDSELVSK